MKRKIIKKIICFNNFSLYSLDCAFAESAQSPPCILNIDGWGFDG